jgi:hypothetical protein
VYSLHKANPGAGDSTARNYAEVFLSKETSENIYVQYFLQRTDHGWDGYNPGLYNGPNGYHNWGGNIALGQLVDDYEMRDGTSFSWNNPMHAADPYKTGTPLLCFYSLRRRSLEKASVRCYCQRSGRYYSGGLLGETRRRGYTRIRYA